MRGPNGETRRFNAVKTVAILAGLGLAGWFILTHIWLILIGVAIVAGGGYVLNRKIRPALGAKSRQSINGRY